MFTESSLFRNDAGKSVLANALRGEGLVNRFGVFCRCDVCIGKGDGDEIGPTRRGKGLKATGFLERQGLRLAVSTHAVNHHEVTLVQLSLDFYTPEGKPQGLIRGRAYDSDRLDGELRNDAIGVIAPLRTVLAR